jgi:hypothetical protein
MKNEIAKLNLDIQRLSIAHNYLGIKIGNAIYKLENALKYLDDSTLNKKEAKRLIQSTITMLDK